MKQDCNGSELTPGDRQDIASIGLDISFVDQIRRALSNRKLSLNQGKYDELEPPMPVTCVTGLQSLDRNVLITQRSLVQIPLLF
jgi:hypothetical protein